MLSALGVGRHGSRSWCWVAISGLAYDVTEFLDQHPGGAGVILRYAGKVTPPVRSTSCCMLNAVQDATKECEPLHPLGTIERNLPIFIAPGAMARLGHPDGELCQARGGVRMAIPQCSATYSSVPHEDIMHGWNNDEQRRGSAPLFQLYVPRQKRDAEQLIVRARDLGFRTLLITVDSPVIGKRDGNDRFQASLDFDAGVHTPMVLPALPGGEIGTLRGMYCSDFEWSDLAWVRSVWGDQPIILEGIQSAEDAFQALAYDVQGIHLTNHGGTSLDYAQSSFETLLEIRAKYPEVLVKLDICLDGGVWRGTDVVKALCLGAKAVGLGRGFMFAHGAHGTEGVLRAIQILSDEIQTTMRLLGVTNLSQLGETHVNTTMLSRDIFSAKL